MIGLFFPSNVEYYRALVIQIRIQYKQYERTYFFPPMLSITGPLRILLAIIRKGEGGRTCKSRYHHVDHVGNLLRSASLPLF